MSRDLQAEITEATGASLHAMPNNRDVIEHVTVIRGYAEMISAYPGNQGYAARLKRSLSKLADLADAHGKRNIAARLRSIEEQLR